MKITVTLSKSGGVLERRIIAIDDEDDSAEVSEAIWNGIDDWILAPGDTIEIGDRK